MVAIDFEHVMWQIYIPMSKATCHSCYFSNTRGECWLGHLKCPHLCLDAFTAQTCCKPPLEMGHALFVASIDFVYTIQNQNYNMFHQSGAHTIDLEQGLDCNPSARSPKILQTILWTSKCSRQPKKRLKVYGYDHAFPCLRHTIDWECLKHFLVFQIPYHSYVDLQFFLFLFVDLCVTILLSGNEGNIWANAIQIWGSLLAR